MAALVRGALGEATKKVERFQTGLQHFVYDVALEGGDRVVARIAGPGPQAPRAIASGMIWTRRLREIGVPVARVRHGSPSPPPPFRPFSILERLPGSDLGNIHSALSGIERKQIAEAVCDAQCRMGRLPAPPGCGYVLADQERAPCPSWPTFVARLLEAGRRAVERGGIVSLSGLPSLARRLGALEGYLAAVQPRLFFDDATTKNVIVSEGRLSGIVDVDSLCVGDPFLALGLTKTALLSLGEDSRYVDYQAVALDASAEERAAIDLYAAIFCVIFLGEHGQRFNRREPEPMDWPAIGRQRAALESLLESSR